MFNVDPNLIVECAASGGCEVIRAVVISLLIFLTLLTGFAYTTLLERRFIAFIQARLGPNRAGPFGLLFPIADAIKLFFKEDVTPTNADRIIFWMAPVLKVIPSIMVVAVVPLGPPLLIPWFDGLWYRVPLGLTDVNVGILFLLAWFSLGTYGIVLAGWASNNKYSMLGGLRASAQMVSYELSLGVSMSIPIIITGSMSLQTIIDSQASPSILGWYVFQNPVAAIILLVALLAEVNRAPFDLPEAEQELTAGYHTEYSGMKFALFFMAEYISMISVSVVAVALFFGGYHFILVDQFPILGPVVYAVKVILFLLGMIWLRATLPRIRYDRLMALGWKVLFPLALVAAGWTALAVLVGDAFGQAAGAVAWISGGVATVIVGAVMLQGRADDEAPSRFEQVQLEQRSLGFQLLGAVGVLLMVPVWLFNGTLRQLRNVQRAVRLDDSQSSGD
ncbi:MAG: NADH-quinone oxidoreductase subunit NuoH [Candidatus Thermofonsia Clade 1 bacterium]|uniref:NADH-quinone oxidoreductase subunit H n=1 Tax=Candidatus Thermofonsia Clade 1 bacterium TaxID=2364210 RepID=A0A2M8PD35_9CHLR|nr:MAG: NADH-quinone oxidoreductase subunit NuoH [Candidatus Thermofonsia Clade 1 bacterium]PJF42484.1 MAG: NADH-quinone oxidoreductase subunit NuoH [Candidatus Thermofonsia Clade 1 bacterium]RMF53990.1 MAG: NADH-quinone oxidoreductase subunit NuoH [Chloroflexota bacterium]